MRPVCHAQFGKLSFVSAHDFLELLLRELLKSCHDVLPHHVAGQLPGDRPASLNPLGEDALPGIVVTTFQFPGQKAVEESHDLQVYRIDAVLRWRIELVILSAEEDRIRQCLEACMNIVWFHKSTLFGAETSHKNCGFGLHGEYQAKAILKAFKALRVAAAL